jgi:hypothetical protein
VSEIPLDGESELPHRKTKLMSSTIILFGIFLKGSVLLIGHAFSLITLIWRSMVGTFSLAAVALRMMPRILPRIHFLIPVSISVVFIVKTCFVYMSKTFLHSYR